MINLPALLARSLFYSSLLALFTFFSGLILFGLVDVDTAIDKYLWYAAPLGIFGFVASLGVTEFVRCRVCGELAMVVPAGVEAFDTPQHQPFKRCCVACGARIMILGR